MVNINKHRLYLFRILKDIYSDIELANCLGFKGGTALMFFYSLPRFSVDLDFNLIDINKKEIVFNKVRDILSKHGEIFDEAIKHYSLLLVLNYGKGERKLKVEISVRQFNDRYEIKNLLGINIKTMVQADMFAHKLCALLDRSSITNRDIFDCWFFMENQTPVYKNLVEARSNMSLTNYLQKCINQMEKITKKNLLQGLGELPDEQMKKFVRTKMLDETIALLKFYRDFPILA